MARALNCIGALSLALCAALAAAQPQPEPAKGVLLVAKPGLVDPNFRQTVVLVTQAADASTVGVILNRPSARRHEQTGEMKNVYLSMDPRNIEMLLQRRGERHRLFAGFAGWAPGQLEGEMQREGWYVLPACADLVFRSDTAGMWEELARKARGRVATR